MTVTPWRRRPGVRRALARGLVVIGVVLGVIAVVTARWGLLIVALLLVGLAAAAGPARAGRDRSR
jgi:CHASE2 domain-containing sensor protein